MYLIKLNYFLFQSFGTYIALFISKCRRQ